jgi:hypothetical protein
MDENRSDRIDEISKVVIGLHHDTLTQLAESERKERERKFMLDMANEVWQKCKGIDIPDCYSEEDRLSIFERYYHRAVAKSQGE